ncbi:MAG: hypothetical protein HY306_11570 [Nitrosomonadales bacterium]|nr:hypothetical protein [Nitrosomonadales bacterium]
MPSKLLPSWPTLRGLSSNSAIRSANIWALIVPITAKLLEDVEEVVKIKLFEHEYSIHLTLPFSWKVLFVAAIAFLLANIFFAVFCPKLIKETTSFRDFAEQRRSGTELQKQLDELEQNGSLAYAEVIQWKNWFGARQVTNMTLTPANDERGFIEVYAIIVDALATSSQPTRFITSALYSVGLLAFAILLIQNICFVAKHW